MGRAAVQENCKKTARQNGVSKIQSIRHKSTKPVDRRVFLSSDLPLVQELLGLTLPEATATTTVNGMQVVYNDDKCCQYYLFSFGTNEQADVQVQTFQILCFVRCNRHCKAGTEAKRYSRFDAYRIYGGVSNQNEQTCLQMQRGGSAEGAGGSRQADPLFNTSLMPSVALSKAFSILPTSSDSSLSASTQLHTSIKDHFNICQVQTSAKLQSVGVTQLQTSVSSYTEDAVNRRNDQQRSRSSVTARMPRSTHRLAKICVSMNFVSVLCCLETSATLQILNDSKTVKADVDCREGGGWRGGGGEGWGGGGLTPET